MSTTSEPGRQQAAEADILEELDLDDLDDGEDDDDRFRRA
jgi:hypothetical protein